MREGFRALKTPRLAINAADWRPTNLAAAREFGIEVQLMSGVGHFIMLEDAPTFNRIMVDALQRFSGPG